MGLLLEAGVLRVSCAAALMLRVCRRGRGRAHSGRSRRRRQERVVRVDDRPVERPRRRRGRRTVLLLRLRHLDGVAHEQLAELFRLLGRHGGEVGAVRWRPLTLGPAPRRQQVRRRGRRGNAAHAKQALDYGAPFPPLPPPMSLSLSASLSICRCRRRRGLVVVVAIAVAALAAGVVLLQPDCLTASGNLRRLQLGKVERVGVEAVGVPAEPLLLRHVGRVVRSELGYGTVDVVVEALRLAPRPAGVLALGEQNEREEDDGT